MKRSVLRILCACLLMGIALAVTAGIFAASQKEEEVYVWQRVQFDSEHALRLYGQNGECDPKQLLPMGEYYALSGDVRTEFVITNDGIAVHSGGWTDGQTVHMTNEAVGSIAVEFTAKDRFYEFVLQGSETLKQVVRGYEGELTSCDFFGLPYGNYDLYLDGKRISAVCIDENTPMFIVLMP